MLIPEIDVLDHLNTLHELAEYGTALHGGDRWRFLILCAGLPAGLFSCGFGVTAALLKTFPSLSGTMRLIGVIALSVFIRAGMPFTSIADWIIWSPLMLTAIVWILQPYWLTGRLTGQIQRDRRREACQREYGRRYR